MDGASDDWSTTEKRNESCLNGCYVRVTKGLFTQSGNEKFL